MRYNLLLNQKAAMELGLTKVNQVIIFDLLTTASTWAEAEIINDEVYYWIARQKIVDELPLLDLKHDTVYRHLKKLDALGMICYAKKGKKDCIKISEKGKKYLSDNATHYVGNESEFNSEMNPTYNTTKDNYASKENSEAFDTLWKDYSLTFLKRQDRRGGNKSKAKAKYMKLIKKYSSQDIYNFVENHASQKFGHKDLERLLVPDMIEQYFEDK